MFGKLKFNSVALGIPKFQMGVNLVSCGFLILAPTKNSSRPTVFRLLETLGVSGSSSTLVYSGLETEWFAIDSVKTPWICRTNELIGQTIDFEITQTLFGAGLCDAKLTLIDANGDPEVVINKMNIKGWGLTIGGGRVRAKLEHHNGSSLPECSK